MLQLSIIDTNVIVSGLISNSKNNPVVQIVNSMLTADFVYVLSSELLAEYREVLLRPKLRFLHNLPDEDIDQLLTEITANAVWIDPQTSETAPDPQDNHIWRLLHYSLNTLLVTGDKLLQDNPPPSHLVITPQAFVTQFL